MTRRPGEHEPVLLAECLKLLAARPGAVFIDCTVNGGGHAAAVLERTGPDGRLLALDVDPEAVSHAQERLAPYGTRVAVRHANFRAVGEVARADGFESVDGILMDLGFSSRQMDAEGRGFSFGRDEPLDMRFDPTTGPSAADLVADADAEELAHVLRTYGEEPSARRIAARLVDARARGPVRTTGQLADLVARAVHGRHSRLHPATRTFQALRIAVNDELGALTEALPEAVDLLRRGGRLAVISFHSLEDRIVKSFFRRLAGRAVEELPPGLPVMPTPPAPVLAIVTPRPVMPGVEEVARNPRSRSARLRVAEKL